MSDKSEFEKLTNITDTFALAFIDEEGDWGAEDDKDDEAIDYAIFAINTLLHPEASSDEDVERLESRAEEVVRRLASLRHDPIHDRQVVRGLLSQEPLADHKAPGRIQFAVLDDGPGEQHWALASHGPVTVESVRGIVHVYPSADPDHDADPVGGYDPTEVNSNWTYIPDDES